MNDLVIVFPGQGSQFPGMGKTWFDAHQSVRDRFRQASDILGHSLEDLCFTAPPGELTKTVNAQVALLVLGHSMYEVLNAERTPPVSAMAGHSLGEITALLAAGALSFEDAVRLVKVRGEAMQLCAEENGAGMVAVLGTPVAEVEKFVAEFNAAGEGAARTVQVSNYNAERQTVLSGALDDLKDVTAHLEERGCKVARLNVGGAFHSTFMANAVPAYVRAIESIEFSQPTVPVYSTVTGRMYTGVQEIKDALSVQLTGPVRWSTVVSALADREVALWLEVGPKQVLTKLLRDAVDGGAVHSLDTEPDEAYAALDALVERKRREPGLVGLCLGAAAATRNRNFDEQQYNDGVVLPYRQLQELGQVDKDAVSDAQKTAALDLLTTIMTTKQVPGTEQRERIAALLARTGDTHLRTATVAGVPAG
ncbi:ACP S-malonyltransferase [Streptomyces globisporus]|uniref:[acyl-carrier-protein] S-malonyltransferase n=1 Tax=Streptomyces globisporus TaxID=1908 RepID=A0A423UZU1_STRGL|nr:MULTISPECIES: ACP S-malonyltransferase [Streptomyces]ROV67882.1 ACP S-malonyltransferase [Streptomyces globisporus]